MGRDKRRKPRRWKAGKHTDPREVSGAGIVGGSAFEMNSSVIDTSCALLLDDVGVALVEDSAHEDIVALQLHGRVNQTKDFVNVLVITDADGAAVLVTDLMALGRRIGGEFEEAFTRRVTELIEGGFMEKQERDEE